MQRGILNSHPPEDNYKPQNSQIFASVVPTLSLGAQKTNKRSEPEGQKGGRFTPFWFVFGSASAALVAVLPSEKTNHAFFCLTSSGRFFFLRGAKPLSKLLENPSRKYENLTYPHTLSGRNKVEER